MVGDVKRCELSLGERYIWIGRIDEMAGYGVRNTRMRRRAESKSAVRDGAKPHEESGSLPWDNSAAVNLLATRIGRPHFGQCQSGVASVGSFGADLGSG